MKITIGKERVETSDIAVVGEYTTSDGPILDDYFLVIVEKDGSVIELAMIDPSANSVLTELSSGLGFPIVRGLANQTDFASRIMYPKEMHGQPLFVRKVPREQRHGFWPGISRELPDDWVFSADVIARCTRNVDNKK